MFDFGKGFATVAGMKTERLQAGIFAGLALLCFALAAGCGRGSAERREARDRYLRRAQAAKDAQDIDRAIALCEQALRRRPDLAPAHRELALMLDNYREDYELALYHYRRYLELRPDSPQRETIEELRRRCRISFAARIAASPEEIARVARARGENVRAAAAEPVAAKAPPAAAPAKTHVVRAGENLATISLQHYGTRAKWKIIFDANRERLTDANNLRVGTSLTIPEE